MNGSGRLARFLRERGYSYEQMPWELCPIPDVPKLEVWEVYALSNPNKTEEQVAAWKARHHPGSE